MDGLEPKRCTAHSRSTGNQCKASAIKGATVCRFHGGSAPQVQRKAAERLALFIDPHLPKIAQRIQEGLDAEETKFFQKDGIVTDSRNVVAWSERRQYAELAMQALQIAKPKESPDVAASVTVQIVHIGGEAQPAPTLEVIPVG